MRDCALLAMALIALIPGSGCTPRSKAIAGPLAARRDSAQTLAQLLESCDAHSPNRDYKGLNINHDTISVLLRVGSADLGVIQDAAEIFLAEAKNDRDRLGREDLMEMLLGLVASDPGRQVHVCLDVLVNKDGELEIEHEWPDRRIGMWRHTQFREDSTTAVKRFGLRDLTSFKAHRTAATGSHSQ